MSLMIAYKSVFAGRRITEIVTKLTFGYTNLTLVDHIVKVSEQY